MKIANELYRKLPEVAKTHFVRDATFEQGVYLMMWVMPALILLLFGLYPISFVLIGAGVWSIWPTRWGTRYRLRQDKRSDRRIAKNNYLAYDPNAEGKALRHNFQIPFRIYDFGSVATIYGRVKKADTIVVSFSGRRGLLDNIEDRYGNEEHIIEVMKTVVAQVTSNIVFSFINGRRPYDPDQLTHDLFNGFLHEDVVKERTATDAWLKSIMAESVQLTIDQGANPVNFVALTIPRPAAWDKSNMEETGITDPDLIPGSDIERLCRAIVPGLEKAGYFGVKILDADELHEQIFRT